ncbi:hypothetical protein NA56DRAFT_700560 [Hyaloscypha hepaticicola]|uniref:Uncharacterized protein n=1 Tax=Hyaloscypha hepaticicola TaxID=2082293 RepID=A0A2J6QCU0_9HELO|nr:hypothetical protein NA56DRAFT_700560 [Hyaloscypha hepaticicola]
MATFAAVDALAAVHRACPLHGAYSDRVLMLCGLWRACLRSFPRLAGNYPVPDQVFGSRGSSATMVLTSGRENNTEKAPPLVGKISRFTYWSVYQGIRRWSHSKQQQKNERLKAKKVLADFKKYKDRGREEYNTCDIHD